MKKKPITIEDIKEQIRTSEERALKMEKYLPIPNTDFLYFNFEEGNWLQYQYSRDIYYCVFEEQEDLFEEFMKNSSLDALIYLFIYLYKDTYPRSEFSLGISLDSNTLQEHTHTQRQMGEK